MKNIDFNIHICGINDKMFTDEIMIYKPRISVKLSISEEDLSNNHIMNISDLINYITGTYNSLIFASIGDKSLNLNSLHFKYNDYLLGFRNDKSLSELFNYVNSDYIEFHSFFCGGASLHYENGYKFSINPSENCHLFSPHVHVIHPNGTVRFYLNTLEPMDELILPHKRDLKKIIIPSIEKYKNELLDLWNHYQNGYNTPIVADNGKQYYPES
jgi:hypothetical protein